eukprot:TRINITY_DN30201_c0_g1_i1.p1 TRINITY_DN30201_c0_g1~~TRINITY_DN30201_c0_g1_i1.p1  ORF type:complete len:418 (-),score=57.37 TRINITY_DN30201_c0_g1_i1:183-1436(-)
MVCAQSGLRLQPWWAVSAWLVVAVESVLDPADVVFTTRDLDRPRAVFVKPTDRVLLISDWPKTAPFGPIKRGRRASHLVLPKILREEVVQDDARGALSYAWLPNVTFHVVHLEDFLLPSLHAGNEKMPQLEGILVKLLDQSHAETDEEVGRVVEDLRTFLANTFQGVCMDDPGLVDGLQLKMRTVMSVLTDMQRLAWVAEHMLQDTIILGDGFILEGGMKDIFTLRLFVWHDFGQSSASRWESGPHEHGANLLLSVQLVGNVEHNIFHRGGLLLDSFEFTPELYRQGRAANGSSIEERTSLAHSSMKGVVLSAAPGSSFFLPPRWIHAPRRPTRNGSIALELYVSLGHDEKCGQVQPPFVRTSAQPPPPTLQHWFQLRWRVLRNRVLAFLRDDSQGALDLDKDVDDMHSSLESSIEL